MEYTMHASVIGNYEEHEIARFRFYDDAKFFGYSASSRDGDKFIYTLRVDRKQQGYFSNGQFYVTGTPRTILAVGA